MSDKDLADALVERGICEKENSINSTMYYIFSDASDGEWVDANDFVRDARVAMACMENSGGVYAHSEIPGKWHCYVESHGAVRLPVDHATAQNESLPRAICMAFVEAMK